METSFKSFVNDVVVAPATPGMAAFFDLKAALRYRTRAGKAFGDR